MVSPPSGQSSGPDPGSVLCDKCKNSVLEPSQNTENGNFLDGIEKAFKDCFLSPRMWPIGYLLGSSYSPFWIEQDLPKRNWRDAFEDLLALENGSDMISEKSREQEKIAAARIGRERASDCIKKLNKLTTRDAEALNIFQGDLDKAKFSQLQKHHFPGLVAGLEQAIMLLRERMQSNVGLAKSLASTEMIRGDFPTSRNKDRGQWMTSLITSGALRGWTSELQDSEDGPLITWRKEEGPEEEREACGTTEYEIHAHFDHGQPFWQGTPGPPLYMASTSEDDDETFVDESERSPIKIVPQLWSKKPERPYFWKQTTAAERINLSSGKMGTKVVMQNTYTDGEIEEKVMIQEPGKILEEVEKARALIHDRLLGLDQPISESYFR